MFPTKRRPIVIGTDAKTGETVYLNRDLLQTHVQIMGSTGTGKTRFTLHLNKEIARDPNATIIEIVAKGSLNRMTEDWTIASGRADRLVVFDAGDKDRIVGYNPLAANGLAVATHARAVREAIRSAWGQASFDQTPQLARFLFLALAVARELNLTVVDSIDVLNPRSMLRRRALKLLSDTPIRDALLDFDSLSESKQEDLAASSVARLETFVQEQSIRRILVQQNRGLHLDEIIRERKILLVTLEQFRPLRTDDVKLLGRLIINDLLAHVFARPEGERSPVYLIIDEAQVFATADLCTALDQGRELGLHCVLANQSPGQFLEEDPTGKLMNSIMNCARTKVLFGGLSVEALESLSKEFFIDEFNPWFVKDEITHLELEPIESRRTVVGDSRSISHSKGRSSGINISRSRQRGWSHAEGEAHSSRPASRPVPRRPSRTASRSASACRPTARLRRPQTSRTPLPRRFPNRRATALDRVTARSIAKAGAKAGSLASSGVGAKE